MSPRAKTLAHLQMLVAAATVACGKKDADHGYGVVDPMPIPTAVRDAAPLPPPVSAAREYADHVSLKVTKRAGNEGTTRYRFVITARPDLVLDEALPPVLPLVLGKPENIKTNPNEYVLEIVAPRGDAGLAAIGTHVRMHGEAGVVDVYVEWKNEQTIVNVSDATPK